MQVSLTVAMIGLIGGGKTTLINSCINKQDEIFPTAGFQIKYVSSGLKPILVYDCSGQLRNYSNWNLLSNLSDAIVFVIDSTDMQTFSVSKKYLFKILQGNKSMKKKNLCIMLNKSDIKERPPREAMYKALQPDKLQKLVSKLYIKQTSAYNKDGFQECLEWFLKNNVQVS